MNKIDLFFAKHMWLTFIVGFIIVPYFMSLPLDYLHIHDFLQFTLGFAWGWFFMQTKIKKYKEFNNQRLNEGLNK